MISIPFKLFRIQQIDSQIDHAQLRCAEIEQKLIENEDLTLAQQRVNQTHQVNDAIISKLSKIEAEVKQQRLKIETSESSLYSGRIQNPKELSDIQKEISSLRRHLTTLEDRQLEAMIEAEESQNEFELAQAAYQKVSENFSQLSVILLDKHKVLIDEINRLLDEKKAAVTGLPEKDFVLYETLRKQRRGVAVSKVNNNSCTACGATINAALLQAASLPGQIARCETCGRILYAG